MGLKLRAEDAEDLRVISAHLQDAILRVGDIAYLPRKHRLLFSINRFCWEIPPSRIDGKEAYQRVTAGIYLDNVLSVKARGIDRDNPESLLYLLAIKPEIGPDESGVIEFVFAGGASLSAQVECVDAEFVDRGDPWLTDSRPQHQGDERQAGRR